MLNIDLKKLYAFAMDELTRHGAAYPDEPLTFQGVSAHVLNHSRKYTHKGKTYLVPKWWSDKAAYVLAANYARDIEAANYVETTADQVIARLVAGWTADRFPDAAQEWLDEHSALLYLTLALQLWAPNSPQWFNTGIFEATNGYRGPKIEGFWTAEVDPQPVEHRYDRTAPHACFIQSTEDTLSGKDGITSLVAKEARLFQHGAGSGANFSKWREEGAPLSGGGTSSGLMSFLKVPDAAAGAIKSGGTTRRAAKMVVIDEDHPDILKAINWKVQEEYKVAALVAGSQLIKDALDRGDYEGAITAGVPESYVRKAQAFRSQGHNVCAEAYTTSWTGEAYRTVDGQNSNNSVRLSDATMRGEDVRLTSRVTGEVVATLPADELLDKIAEAAWLCADPGVQFMDTINAWNTCPEDGSINASNPCSEYLFLDNTACNLASINLLPFFGGDGLNDGAFCQLCALVTVVLDRSISIAMLPTYDIARGTALYRTLGLGYANLGAVFMARGYPYASTKAVEIAGDVTFAMHDAAASTSRKLASAMGAFPRYEANKEHVERVYEYQTGRPVSSHGYRNAQLTCIAPTGTIGMLMDCDSTGIEPVFSLVTHKTLVTGETMTLPTRVVESCFQAHGLSAEDAAAYVAGEYKGLIPHGLQDALMFANDLSCDDHLAIVAAAQPFLSGGISKTINLPADATVADVLSAIEQAWTMGVKAISIYRDQSKMSQPLSSSTPVASAPTPTPAPSAAPARRKLPAMRKGYTRSFGIGGHKVYLRTGEYEDGQLGEVFLSLKKEGGTLGALLSALSISVSMNLQYGVPLETICDWYIGTRFEPSGFVDGHDEIKMGKSIIDVVFRELAIQYLGQTQYANVVAEDAPQPVYAPKTAVYLPDACPACGKFALVPNGTCTRCTECGGTTGCS